MTKLDTSQVQTYLQTKGLKCPLCGGDMETEGPISEEGEDGQAYRSVRCGTCHASFTEQWQLVGIEHDDVEYEGLYENEYVCTACGNSWSEILDCIGTSECACCGLRDIEPERSHLI